MWFFRKPGFPEDRQGGEETVKEGPSDWEESSIRRKTGFWKKETISGPSWQIVI